MKPQSSLPCSQEPTITEARSNIWLQAVFYGKDMLTLRSTPSLVDHPLSAALDCLFNIFSAILHIWRPCPPFDTRRHAMLWRQGST